MSEASGKPNKPARTIRLARERDADGVAVFEVTAGRETAFYAVREVVCDIGGRGFEVHRLGLGTLYHVRVGTPSECSCECKGFLYHGQCRHVLGLLALIREGKL
jgi:hypothetical protein